LLPHSGALKWPFLALVIQGTRHPSPSLPRFIGFILNVALASKELALWAT
jgi:hypothetical protein